MKNTEEVTEAVSYTHLDVYKRQVVKTHTGLVYREANGVVQVNKPYDRRASMNETHDAMAHYGVKDFYEFATGIPLEEIAFCLLYTSRCV